MSEKQALDWLNLHGERLNQARTRIRERGFWNAFPETPSEKIHGEGAKEAGRKSFESRLENPFAFPGFDSAGETGGERSPYGFALNVRYPAAAPEELIRRAAAAGEQLAAFSPDARMGIAMEAMGRLWARNFELAYSVMHTSGQGFVMSFQAGAAHALERALEAAVCAEEEMRRIPPIARWEKPRGKRPPLLMEKRFRVMPRGVGLVVACATFPTWNSYPAIFANVVCGNPVIVKPHPAAALPLAITVEVLRDVFAEAGLERDAAVFAADSADAPIAKKLAADPRVKLIDFTGGSAFGEWLEQNTPQAKVFAEKSGVNCVLVGETARPEEVARNLAFSLSLYSGQMCTSPQNIFIPEAHFAQTADALNDAMDGLLSDNARAVEVLGAIQSEETMRRIKDASALPGVARESKALSHPHFEGARVQTPLLAKLTTKDGELYRRECFGPVAYLIKVADEEEGLREMRSCIESRGALTALIYADDEDLVARALDTAARAGVNAAANLSGEALVNHSSAFSDYHGTGANPACGACLTDAAFVASRFYVAQSRRMLAAS